jgi:signal transduction histidine kinase/CheY-like chemotaxis protein
MKTKTFIQSLIYAGVNDSIENARQCVCVNFISLVCIVLCYSIGPLFYLVTKDKLLLWGALSEGVIFAMVILLNYHRRYKTASLVFYAIHNLAVLYFSMLFGSNVQVASMTIFLIALSRLIFSGKLIRVICAVISIVILIAIEYNTKVQIVQQLSLTQNEIIIITWFSFAIIITLVILLFWFYEKYNIHLVNKLADSKALELNTAEQRKFYELIAKEKEKASLEKSIYLRKVSHEVRTPINVVYIIGQILEEEAKVKEEYSPIREMVRHLILSCSNARTIVNNVLEFSKIEAGKADELFLEGVDLRELMDNVVSICSYLSQEKSVTICVSIAPEIPIYVSADKTKLNQITTNLLTNAIKFTRHSSVVSVSIYTEGEKWVLAIKDEGEGIEMNMLDEIFNPYVSEGKQSVNPGGIGLGLPITKTLIECLQGEIIVKSKIGFGSSFYVKFPLIENKISQIAAPTLKEAINLTKIEKKVVLIIEDDPMTLVYLKLILNRRGLDVIIAKNGEEGIKLAMIAQPNLIITDMYLPDFTGMEVIRFLKANPKLCNIPIFVSSADAFNEGIDEVLRAGADEFITKPMELTILYKALGRHVY